MEKQFVIKVLPYGYYTGPNKKYSNKGELYCEQKPKEDDGGKCKKASLRSEGRVDVKSDSLLYRILAAKGADEEENSVYKSRKLSVIESLEQILAPHKNIQCVLKILNSDMNS